MTMTPDWISKNDYEDTVDALKEAKNPPAIEKIRLQEFTEGLCVQIMHVGSYDDEAETLANLHDKWLPKSGYVETGKHHEIYISDPRRTAPEKLKTILRQPVKVV